MLNLTQVDIVNLLATNDKAIARALVVLNERQTEDEKRSEETRHLNGRGFQPCHARMGTSMAGFYTRNGYLSPKQLQYWRKPNKRGTMRIAVYWRQLLEVAKSKAAAPTGMLSPSEVKNFDRARSNYVHVTSPRVFEAFSPTGAE